MNSRHLLGTAFAGVLILAGCQSNLDTAPAEAPAVEQSLHERILTIDTTQVGKRRGKSIYLKW